MKTQSEKTKIFFDGNCIVCDLEISHYQRKAPELFELVDISATDFKASDYGLNLNEVQKDMHVFTPEGELRIGVDAFAHIWSRIKNYQWAATLIKKPIIQSVAKLGYEGFTIIRPFLPKKK